MIGRLNWNCFVQWMYCSLSFWLWDWMVL